MVSNTVIGSGFPERSDPAALVIGPTGVGLSLNGTLYVANTVKNTIRAIPNALSRTSSAGTGMLASSPTPAASGLNAPLGLAIASNGNILTVNGGDGNIVETTPGGIKIASRAHRPQWLASGRRRPLRLGPGAPRGRLLRGRRHQHA